MPPPSQEKPLRLLMVSEPGIDGVFSIVKAVVRKILRDHPEILVDLAYSSRRSGSELRDLVRDVEAHGGRAIDLRVGNAPCPGDFAALLRLVLFARQRGHQLAHAHSSKAGALSRIARFLFPFFPPVFYTPHAYYGMAGLGGLKERFYDSIESMLGRIGTTICTSEDERDFALSRLHIPRDRVLVIDNGIDTARFAPADGPARDRARASLALPPEGKLLVAIGRDSKQKNYEPLYSVLNNILPQGDWNFAHAGKGSSQLRAGLSPKAARHCHAFEHLDNIPTFLQAADGYVMTSLYEGLSLAMMEALSTGLPVFLTDAPGFRFLKKLGFTKITWLPDPEDPVAVKKSLEGALRAWAQQPAEILLEQRDLVCRDFCQDVQIEKLIARYKHPSS